MRQLVDRRADQQNEKRDSERQHTAQNDKPTHRRLPHVGHMPLA